MSSRASWLLGYVFSDHSSGNADARGWTDRMNQLGGTFWGKADRARCPEVAKVGSKGFWVIKDEALGSSAPNIEEKREAHSGTIPTRSKHTDAREETQVERLRGPGMGSSVCGPPASW